MQNSGSRGSRGALAAVAIALVVVLALVVVWLRAGRVGGAGSAANPPVTTSGPVPTTATARPTGVLLPVTAAEVADASHRLASLAVIAPPTLGDDYRRAAFGEAWTDTDGNGCNQRDDVLLRDLDPGRPYRLGQQGGCDHDVLAGTWVDPYTGTTITLTDAKEQAQAESVQIDHIVALSVAWRYGADGWSDEQRLAFANDLRNLVASGGPANQSKGGSDASQWQPVRAARCGFAVRYVVVKDAYRLPTDQQEKEALEDMLATCG